MISEAADRARLLFGTNSSQVEEAGQHSRGVSRLVVHHKYDLKGELHIFSHYYIMIDHDPWQGAETASMTWPW